MPAQSRPSLDITIVALWVFLAPLILLLGLLDIATRGRSRNWPFPA